MTINSPDIKMKTRSFTCTSRLCYKSFRDQESLDAHLKTHKEDPEIDPKDFTCKICNRELATKQSLKEHGFIHFEKKPFRCSEIGCGKMFRQSSQLCNHRKVHKEARRLLKKQSEKKNSCDIFPEFIQDSVFDKESLVLPPISFPVFGVVLPSLFSQAKY